jgi:hypothetical protein
VGDWCNEYEKDYWQKVKRTPEREVNWNKDHGLVFSKLPQDEQLTIEVLLEYIQTTEPDSRSRKRACDYCYKLAEFAGLEGREQIRSLTGNYSSCIARKKRDRFPAIKRFLISATVLKTLAGAGL